MFFLQFFSIIGNTRFTYCEKFAEFDPGLFGLYEIGFGIGLYRMVI